MSVWDSYYLSRRARFSGLIMSFRNAGGVVDDVGVLAAGVVFLSLPYIWPSFSSNLKSGARGRSNVLGCRQTAESDTQIGPERANSRAIHYTTSRLSSDIGRKVIRRRLLGSE